MDKVISEILKNYSTPFYVFDVETLRKRVDLIKDTLGKIKLVFAMKANPFLVKSMDSMVERLEVCSPGEYEICIKNNIDPEKIVVSGVNKTYESMKKIFEYSKGKGIYTIESRKHFEVLKKCADEGAFSIDIIPRLSSKNQFGMDEETLIKVLDDASKCNNINIVGIHYYSGTQKKMKKIEKEIKRLNEFGNTLKERYNLPKLSLEYGPGLCVGYFSNEEVESAKDQLDNFAKVLKAADSFDEICIEMGRFLTSDCGYYATSVMDKKINNGEGYLIIDGGIHQINYFGQLMGMKKPYIHVLGNDADANDVDANDADSNDADANNTDANDAWTICGSLCTTNDVIVRGQELPSVKEGSTLVFEKCGAYSVTEGIAMFLSRDLPKIFIHDKDTICVREKIETNQFNS